MVSLRVITSLMVLVAACAWGLALTFRGTALFDPLVGQAAGGWLPPSDAEVDAAVRAAARQQRAELEAAMDGAARGAEAARARQHRERLGELLGGVVGDDVPRL
jgi:hypothetical protein